MKIHGYAAFAAQEPLQPFSYDLPQLEPFEVLIKVSHCGLCLTDVLMIENAWNRSTYPLLPGHEGIGTIVQKGAFVTANIGDRVGASWVRSACLECPLCLQGETNICPNKKGCYNNGAYGGFADHMVVDSRFAFPIPEKLSSAHAAPLLCAGATVYAPLRKFGLQANHHVAILGIGGLGHLALQFAKAFGCEVTALSSSASKKPQALQWGATHFHLLDALPPPSQYDFLLCTADAPLDWNRILTLLKPNGTLCFVSRPSKGLFIDPAFFVSTQRKIVGSNNANRALMHEMLFFAANHAIAPLIELMPLHQVNAGIERLKQNKVRYRIVLTH